MTRSPLSLTARIAASGPPACPAMSPACAALAPGDYVFQVLPGSAMATNPYTIQLTITPM